MPFTSAKGLSVQTLNANIGTWGVGASDSLNTGCFEPIDNMLGGINTQTLSSVTPIVFDTETAQKALIRLTGALLASIVIGPDSGVLMQGFYFFENLTTNSAFTVTFTNSAGSVVLPQGRRGVMWVDTINGPRVMSSVGSSQTDVLPAGTTMPFYNAAVPTGWSAVAINNYSLKIVSTGNGGVTSGSVDYSTLFGRTGTDPVTLVAGNIPATGLTYEKNTTTTFVNTGTAVGVLVGTTSTPLTGAAGTSFTPAIDMRVKTVALTLGTRN